MCTKTEELGFIDRDVYARNSVGINRSTHYSATGFFFQFKIATGVIRVMVCVQNIGQLPAGILQRLFNGGNVGSVNAGRDIAGFAVTVKLTGIVWGLLDAPEELIVIADVYVPADNPDVE